MMGAINGYRGSAPRTSGLRVHRDFEWPDTYSWWNIEDLTRFFDRYLKGIPQRLGDDPEVRLDIMDAYEVRARPAGPRTTSRSPAPSTPVLLDARPASCGTLPCHQRQRLYDPDSGGPTSTSPSPRTPRSPGSSRPPLGRGDGHDEMDLFLTVLKLGTDGQWLPHQRARRPHPGAWGRLRVSHRDLDEKLSTDYQPVQSTG